MKNTMFALLATSLVLISTACATTVDSGSDPETVDVPSAEADTAEPEELGKSGGCRMVLCSAWNACYKCCFPNGNCSKCGCR